MNGTMRCARKSDLAVLILAVVLLCVCLSAVGPSGRERAGRAVCLANLGELTSAWNQYAEDNDGDLVNGDTGEYGFLHEGELSWVLTDWLTGVTVAKRQAAITGGALFPYTQDLRLYRCPREGPSSTRSYTIVDSMNCMDWPEMKGRMIKNTSEIDQPAARCVFIRVADLKINMGGWTCYVRDERWWDPPPLCHRDGTNLSFADGHAEHWMWKDARTVEFGRRSTSVSSWQAGNEDIRRVQAAVWGTASGSKPSGGGGAR